MKKIIFTIIFTAFVFYLNAQEITDIVLNGNENIYTISYNITDADEGQTFNVILYYKIDNGTWQRVHDNLTGAVGANLTAGTNKIITWQPKQTIEGNLKVKIQATVKNKAPSTDNMVFVKGGTFQMGSSSIGEKPIHSVTVSDFYIGKYEVTFAEYDKFCDATGRSKPSDRSWGRGNRPVINVSWNDATAYCNWLSQTTGQTYRLPTEAEWEYAAGGASASLSNRTKWAGTNSKSSLGSYAWYDDNSGSKTHPVGTKSPNSLGIYDMSGNVWEWCSDWYGDYSSSAQTNPQGPSSSSFRVIRGGSWYYNAIHCRVAIRNGYNPPYGNYYLGFRLVRAF